MADEAPALTQDSAGGAVAASASRSVETDREQCPGSPVAVVVEDMAITVAENSSVEPDHMQCSGSQVAVNLRGLALGVPVRLDQASDRLTLLASGISGRGEVVGVPVTTDHHRITNGLRDIAGRVAALDTSTQFRYVTALEASTEVNGNTCGPSVVLVGVAGGVVFGVPVSVNLVLQVPQQVQQQHPQQVNQQQVQQVQQQQVQVQPQQVQQQQVQQQRVQQVEQVQQQVQHHIQQETGAHPALTPSDAHQVAVLSEQQDRELLIAALRQHQAQLHQQHQQTESPYDSDALRSRNDRWRARELASATAGYQSGGADFGYSGGWSRGCLGCTPM
mmetsp:Transcript_6545/g.11157  ORF Transcript_6545/g.11157 Transcript_6545/m.11157 type:complete len:333 (+) Transcript_6545:1331-2329(+)